MHSKKNLREIISYLNMNCISHILCTSSDRCAFDSCQSVTFGGVLPLAICLRHNLQSSDFTLQFGKDFIEENIWFITIFYRN